MRQRFFDSTKLMTELKKLRSDSRRADAEQLARRLIEIYDTKAIVSAVEIEVLAGDQDANPACRLERTMRSTGPARPVADHLDLEPDVPDRGPDPPAQRARRQPQPRQVGPRFPGRAARAYRRSARSPGQAERSHSPGLDAALPGPGPVRGNEPHDGDPCPDRQRR